MTRDEALAELATCKLTLMILGAPVQAISTTMRLIDDWKPQAWPNLVSRWQTLTAQQRAKGMWFNDEQLPPGK